jgi:hypothetical protein
MALSCAAERPCARQPGAPNQARTPVRQLPSVLPAMQIEAGRRIDAALRSAIGQLGESTRASDAGFRHSCRMGHRHRTRPTGRTGKRRRERSGLPGPRHGLLGPGVSPWTSCGGGGGIRTLGTVARTTVFETAPIDHSGTPPTGPLRADGRTHIWGAFRAERGASLSPGRAGSARASAVPQAAPRHAHSVDSRALLAIVPPLSARRARS